MRRPLALLLGWRLRVAVLARVLERLQHVRDDRLVRRDRQVLGVEYEASLSEACTGAAPPAPGWPVFSVGTQA